MTSLSLTHTHTHTRCPDVTIGLGIVRYDQEITNYKDRALLWIYLGAAIFSVLFSLFLFIFFSAEATFFRKNGE